MQEFQKNGKIFRKYLEYQKHLISPKMSKIFKKIFFKYLIIIVVSTYDLVNDPYHKHATENKFQRILDNFIILDVLNRTISFSTSVH